MHGVVVSVQLKLEDLEVHCFDGDWWHYVVKQPPIVGDELEGAEDEGLIQHVVAKH